MSTPNPVSISSLFRLKTEIWNSKNFPSFSSADAGAHCAASSEIPKSKFSIISLKCSEEYQLLGCDSSPKRCICDISSTKPSKVRKSLNEASHVEVESINLDSFNSLENSLQNSLQNSHKNRSPELKLNLQNAKPLTLTPTLLNASRNSYSNTLNSSNLQVKPAGRRIELISSKKANRSNNRTLSLPKKLYNLMCGHGEGSGDLGGHGPGDYDGPGGLGDCCGWARSNAHKECNFLLFRDKRHRTMTTVKRLRQSNDVAENPGPGPTARAPILAVTYNVRGLGDERKLRHLLHHMQLKKAGKNLDFVACLQETYLETPGKIPYIWRGNYALTPGNGHSCGCLTLLSSHLNVLSSKDIGSRAHILAVQKSGDPGVTYIIANLYAPNPNSNQKLNFFVEVFEAVAEFQERYNCQTVLMLGDFNLTFKATEMRNRNYTTQEQRVAKAVREEMDGLDIGDIWDTHEGFTWRRPNTDTFSTIDRILFSSLTLRPGEVKENWSLSYSDHAAVEVNFYLINSLPTMRSKITRLDPSLAKTEWTRNKIETDFNEMFSTVPGNWDPHAKLEFAKVCIRTVVEQTQAERKRTEASEEDSINEELELAIAKLSIGELTGNRMLSLIDYVEQLRTKKEVLINVKGERLAERLGTKWYNEGEKSTRYFLRLLNRATPDDFKSVAGPNGDVTDPTLIENEIVNFYKTLYENYDKSELGDIPNDDFFSELERVHPDGARELTEPLTISDLEKTLHSCRDSAPGPDGIPYSIIGLLWSTYGKLLCDAWNYSLRTGKLPPSHKVSYLKLIPKAEKDLKYLTNWRPITLSNCDHKLITKTYATKMSEIVSPLIKERQTAYLKGRLINDNIRAMLATVNLANLEDRCSGVLVSLDARKAFDSVEHSYIERCLKELGLESFNRIFRLLYSELATDILINGKVVKGFNILRGVKQGDSLSCILFIICMEPLLRNLEKNNSIHPIESEVLGTLPKSYAYADDVNCTIKDNNDSVQAVFSEYERLSRRSGLILNADKTEVMRLGQQMVKTYQILYMGKLYQIKTKNKIKINGIDFQSDRKAMVECNVRRAMSRMDKFFKAWTRRNLSTLGRIMIVKTFAISQIIFIMQSMELDDSHFKAVNSLLYKFIWNRRYLASKAPERVKREIMNKPITLGGYGMLDIEALDASLKIKAIGRLHNSSHPFLTLLRAKCDFDFFEPVGPPGLETVTSKGLKLLRIDRDGLWGNEVLQRNVQLIELVQSLKISSVLDRHGKLSIPYFMIRQRGATRIKDITLRDLGELERYIEVRKIPLIRNAVNLPTLNLNAPMESYVLINGKFKEIVKCTSKEIRASRTRLDPIQNLKLGINLTRPEASNWGFKLAKLTSIKHRNMLLRVAHGEIYTKEKLHRYNLIDNDRCPRCGEAETLNHKFIECDYVRRIWRYATSLTANLISANQNQLPVDSRSLVLGSFVESTPTILTLHAEILQRILYLREEQNYLVHPKTLVTHCLKLIARSEKRATVRDEIKSLLEQ